jgi:hypothetical protein
MKERDVGGGLRSYPSNRSAPGQRKEVPPLEDAPAQDEQVVPMGGCMGSAEVLDADPTGDEHWWGRIWFVEETGYT